MFVSRWTVDYGDGPHPVVLPHAWGQEVSLEWEGPAVYRTEVDVPRGGGTLRFWGVSYAAMVLANGLQVVHHEGIWDAFDVPLPGGKVEVEVRVVKNGGATYPVRSVLSGSLPEAFATFGGIYREVELLESTRTHPLVSPPATRTVRPYLRGLLHLGWYPELGHPNPEEHTIRREVRAAKDLGFNLVKLGGWLPPHRYLDVLSEEGMLAWIDLPVGPSERTEAIFDEIERIVLQYRHHPAIVVWTVGHGLPSAQRQRLVAMVDALTGLTEIGDAPDDTDQAYGDFEVYDLRAELPFFPMILDELRDTQRNPLLGRTGDHDVHRDLARLGDELPYWASALPELNAPGVRTDVRLPNVLDVSRFSIEPTKSRHKALMESSRRKALFVRKTATEAIRAHPAFDGYVVDGWRDTPESSSGLFDDWGAARFSPEECRPWNAESVLFVLPTRRPVWTHGGLRAGWLDGFSHFEGEVALRLGADGEGVDESGLSWRIVDDRGTTVARGTGDGTGGRQLEMAQVVWPKATAGEYRLEARCGAAENAWPLWIVPRSEWSSREGWGVHDPAGLVPELSALPDGEWTVAVRRLGGEKGVLLLDEEGTLPMPFWRECAQEFADPAMERWERLLPVSPDRALDSTWLRTTFGAYEVLINRVDTRTYQDHPLLVRAGAWIVTTLRPQGGLGAQPSGLRWNPAGCALLENLMALAQGTTTLTLE